MNAKIQFAISIAAVSMLPTAAAAADHEVQMLNRDAEGRVMQFEPAFLQIAVGDTVTFIAADPGHNSESILEMVPEGADPWKGKINEEITVTFDQEGYYGYKCQPHFALGMVGLIQVGEPDAAPDSLVTDRLPGRAEPRMAELIGEASEAAAAEGAE